MYGSTLPSPIKPAGGTRLRVPRKKKLKKWVVILRTRRVPRKKKKMGRYIARWLLRGHDLLRDRHVLRWPERPFQLQGHGRGWRL